MLHNKTLQKTAGVLLLIVFVGIFTIGSSLVTAKPVQAGASGCTRWGSIYIPVVHMSLPSGQYCFTIQGKGTTVTNTISSEYSDYIANFAEIVHFYDMYGKEYATIHTHVHYGNAWGLYYWSSGIHGTAKKGSVCGELLASGTSLTKACEAIF